MIKVPTIKMVVEAQQSLQAATQALNQAKAKCDEYARFSPLQIAFAAGASVSWRACDPAYDWAAFVAHFGDLPRAREQFDAGVAARMLANRAGNSPDNHFHAPFVQALHDAGLIDVTNAPGGQVYWAINAAGESALDCIAVPPSAILEG